MVGQGYKYFIIGSLRLSKYGKNWRHYFVSKSWSLEAIQTLQRETKGFHVT